MFSRLAAVWRVPELWRKILLTIGLLGIYRLGFHITLPFIDHDGIRKAAENAGGGGLADLMQMMSLFSASSLTNGSLFGLGIMPYITASIVFQLLGTVYPPLEQLQKEGESGRRRINEYTRYATVVICLLQSFFIIKALSSGQFGGDSMVLEEYNSTGWFILGSIVMTCGTVFLMWIGEQIDTYGIGNGISLLIMGGILAQMPAVAGPWISKIAERGVGIGEEQGIDKLLMMAALFVGVIVCVVCITQGQRKIPIQSARHVRGRKVMGGQRQWLPLRVNQAGVMPIIFASSLLLLPFFVLGQLSSQVWPDSVILGTIAAAFQPGQGFVYNLCYIILIYFFCYFWTAITFNPKDMADNLKDMGSFIPGYRPGARTAAHLEQVMTRVTYAGAAFLAIIAVIPTIISTTLTNGDFRTAQFFGGTGLLIIVSVALDLVQKIDSHLIMRNYPGLLDTDD